MSNKDKGGPAFPVTLATGQSYIGHAVSDGMTLRDYFAAKAMQGLLASPTDPASAKTAAEFSYRVADAMLEARK